MRYRKKPIVIEAIQFTGNNWDEVSKFVPNANGYEVGDGQDKDGNIMPQPHYAMIHILEGTMRADIGDWIIMGIKGEFYSVKDEIFKETYERVD